MKATASDAPASAGAEVVEDPRLLEHLVGAPGGAPALDGAAVARRHEVETRPRRCCARRARRPRRWRGSRAAPARRGRAPRASAGGRVVARALGVGPVAQEAPHARVLPAVVDEQRAQPAAVGLRHLDELEPGARRQRLGGERRPLRVPPGDAAAGAEGDLGARPGHADLERLVDGQRLGPLDEGAGEADVDQEHLFGAPDDDQGRPAGRTGSGAAAAPPPAAWGPGRTAGPGS